MTVRSGQSITVDFVTCRFDTGVATAADSLPTGTLVVNGTDDAATVAITDKTDGKYKAAVTLPTLALGDVAQIRIAATVNSVSGVEVIWTDMKDVLLDANGKTTDAVQTGDSYAIANSGTYGNAALKTLIDSISAKTANLPSDPADQSELAALIAALSSQLNSAVWAQTRFRFSIPEAVEIPESGTNIYTLGISTYNASGVLTDCDATPTVTAFYADGTSAAAILGTVTNVATGLYNLSLSVASTVVGPLFVRFVGTAAMASLDIGMTDYTWLMDDVSPDFSSSDRTKLEAIHGKLPSGDIADQSLVMLASSYTAPDNSTISTINTKLGTPAGASVSADIASVKTDTGNLVTRITSTLFSGITSLGQWLGLLAGKQVGNTTARTELRATGAGSGTFTESTDSLEAIKDSQSVTVSEFSNDALTQLAAATTINLVTPSVSNNTITIVQGDDYLTADGRQLQFTNSAGTWPDLTGANVVLRFRVGTATVSVTDSTVVTATGANQRVDVDVTSAESVRLSRARGTFELEATLANSSVATLMTGPVNVTIQIG